MAGFRRVDTLAKRINFIKKSLPLAIILIIDGAQGRGAIVTHRFVSVRLRAQKNAGGQNREAQKLVHHVLPYRDGYSLSMPSVLISVFCVNLH